MRVMVIVKADEDSEAVAQSDAILLGRRPYQQFAEFWPNQASDVPMAGYLNTTPKYVVSATLDKVEWQNSTLIKGNVVEQLAKLQQPGRNIRTSRSPAAPRWCDRCCATGCLMSSPS